MTSASKLQNQACLPGPPPESHRSQEHHGHMQQIQTLLLQKLVALSACICQQLWRCLAAHVGSNSRAQAAWSCWQASRDSTADPSVVEICNSQV